ncbi:conjugal transfer protein TraG N-terminal domain-containing protein [Providencia sp. PROV255]|uniref:conjugal transfer protein TraG N-terminal domain-containing protein n=1 Tax=Providencia sp. PROV255 TaxID=2949943 RepID=UPI00234A213A|nr:conjugal transfer protein TraG N-terminal domain-containing protein [Providencia sp. PROV255]
MTEWNVYTVGDIEFMHNVFNAIAMLMNSGMFSDLFRIAALLGVIGIVISSAISAGKTISFQNMAVCIVMYMVFFQVSARVNIEDVTSGRFRAVDNVPAGLAASASIISTVGYSITEKMEQAFSTPSMTEYGALDPLVALSTFYDSMKNPMKWFMANEKPRVDFARSIQNYMKTCVMNDIARGAKTYSTLYRSTEGVQALRSTDSFQRVVLYDGQMVGWDPSTPDMKDVSSQYTCAEAYDKLNMMYSSSTKMLTAAFQRSYKALGRDCVPGKSCSQSSKAQEILNFYNISGTTMRDFQMTMIMYPYLRDVPKYGHEAAFRGAAAVTRTQTQTQQAFQWASSGASFLSWMAAFMPIFQGLIYALTPFMAFLVGLGIMGVRLIMKYFLVIIWTQTWMPLAAIVNMYVLVHTQNNLSVIFSDPGQVSFDKLYIMLYETQKSIGLAGNLYAMIPALGGFIVWGSSVAFNSLANSAAAPHAADTKQMAPDVSNAPAMNNRSADVNFDRSSGSVMGGASSALPKFDMKQSASTNLASAKQNVESASAERSASEGKMFQEVASNMRNGTQSQQSQDAMQAALGSLTSSQRSFVQDVASRNGTSEAEALTALNMGSVQGTAQAKAGLEFAGSGASVSGSASLQRNESATKGKTHTADASYSSSDNASNSDAMSSQLSQIKSQSSMAYYSSMQASGQNTAATQQYSEAYKKQESAQKSYSEAQQYSMSSSMGQNMNSAQIAQSIGGSPEAQAALTQVLAGREDLTQRVNEDTARLSSLGMTQEDAHTFAQFSAAASIGQAGEVAKLSGFVSGGSQQPELSSDAARANQGIAGKAEQAEGHINNIAGGVDGNSSSTQGQAAAGIAGNYAESAPGAAQGRVIDQHFDNRGMVDNHEARSTQEMNTLRGNAARYELVNKSNYGMTGDAMPKVQSALDKVSNGIKPGGFSYQEGYGQAQEMASQVTGVGGERGDYAKNAISHLYGTVKDKDNTPEQMEHARIQAFHAVSLATGGEYVNGRLEGGDQQLAMAIIGKVESTKSNMHRTDAHVVKESVESIMSDHTKK